jgi:hypothetical protein
MRVAILLICLAIAGCQSASDTAPAGSSPAAAGKPTTPTDGQWMRERFGGRCSPYASNCW